MILIGITGQAGCGKTTVAKYLAETYSFKLHNFSQPIKEMLAVLLGISVEDIDHYKDSGIKHPILGTTIRSALQTLGTEWGRNIIDKDIWTNVVMSRIQLSKDPFHVIGDVRFNNEADAIRANNGRLLYIKRSVTDRLSENESNHASELEFNTILINHHRIVTIINNDGSIENLFKNIDTYIGTISENMFC